MSSEHALLLGVQIDNEPSMRENNARLNLNVGQDSARVRFYKVGVAIKSLSSLNKATHVSKDNTY